MSCLGARARGVLRISLVIMLQGLLRASEVDEELSKKYSIEIMVDSGVSETGERLPLLPFERIPDSHHVRRVIAQDWFLDEPSRVALRAPRSYTDETGNSFRVEAYVIAATDHLAVRVTPLLADRAPRDGVHSAPVAAAPRLHLALEAPTGTSRAGRTGADTPQSPVTDAAPSQAVAQGTWVLYRHMHTGAPVCIRVYPRESASLYVQLSAPTAVEMQGKTHLDVCLFNVHVRKHVALGLSFEQLYTYSLLQLRALTEHAVPWRIFDPPRTYSAVESMASIIKRRSYRLAPLEDGCFNEWGRPVHISDGSSQSDQEIIRALRVDQVPREIIGGVGSLGFAKWVVDGIIAPVAGQGVYLSALKKQTTMPRTHFNAAHERARAPFFGIDWIRNLAAAALSLNVRRTVYPAQGGVDVTVEPFAVEGVPKGRIKQEARHPGIAPPSTPAGAVPPRVTQGETAAGPSRYLGYLPHAGYQTGYVRALFYYLAVMEPGHFYLGVLNEERGVPRLREYQRAAVFLPYFDRSGRFQVEVFEAARLSTLEEFVAQYPQQMLALVRVRAPEISHFNP